MSYQVVPLPEGVSLGEATNQQAYGFVPKAWYEDDWIPHTLYFLTVLPAFAWFWWRYGLNPPLEWSVISVVVFVVGLGADRFTTWRCLRLMPAFKRRHVPFPLEEKNPMMKRQPTTWEQIANASSLVHLATVVGAWFMPAIGVVGGLAHARAAWNNQRQAQRLKVQLRLLDLHRVEEAQTKGKGQKHTESQE